MLDPVEPYFESVGYTHPANSVDSTFHKTRVP
jgi:hypothetical protein